MKKVLFAVLLVVCIALLPAGCNQTSNRTSATDPFVDDSNGWGGYETTAEDQYFAEESSALPYDGNEEGEADPDDELSGDPDLVAAQSNPNRVIYLMRLDWGQLAYNPNFTGELVWSGTLEINCGAILVSRKYRFEYILNNDHIVRPRTSAKSVSWESKTYTHHDGVLFSLITDPDFANSTSVTLTMDHNGEQFQRVFTLSQLNAYDKTENADDQGNKISIHAAKTNLGQVIDGVLGGRWAAGKMIGRWIALDGTVKGKFEGIYGINAQGKRVFFGKIVQADGTFEGLMKGGWCPVPFTFGLIGWYLGVYTDENAQVVGLLGGHYIKGFVAEGGWLRGIWHEGLPAGWDPNNPPDPEDEEGTTPNP